MPEQLFAVTVKATGEVRDKDGNLIESIPIEQTVTMTEAELRDFQEGLNS